MRIEAEALTLLAERLDGVMAADFDRAVDYALACGRNHRRIILCGIGKSGIIAQKIAATFNSTGSSAFFLHPAEAAHGDLGALTQGDLIVALSTSGETEEVLRLLETIKQLDDVVISLCGDTRSTLAHASDVVLDCSVGLEACGLGLAPTASTTTMLALGDALAIEVSIRKGFRVEDFAALHPAGGLGRRLARVGQLMHTANAIPCVTAETPMKDVIYEMSRKKLGITTVANGGRLAGVISDGDLRRLIERDGPDCLTKTAGEVMNARPHIIAADERAVGALEKMKKAKITSLVVVTADGTIEGIVHLHDLWGARDGMS